MARKVELRPIRHSEPLFCVETALKLLCFRWGAGARGGCVGGWVVGGWWVVGVGVGGGGVCVGWGGCGWVWVVCVWVVGVWGCVWGGGGGGGRARARGGKPIMEAPGRQLWGRLLGCQSGNGMPGLHPRATARCTEKQ